MDLDFGITGYLPKDVLWFCGMVYRLCLRCDDWRRLLSWLYRIQLRIPTKLWKYTLLYAIREHEARMGSAKVVSCMVSCGVSCVAS